MRESFIRSTCTRRPPIPARIEPFPLCLSRPGQEMARLQVGRFDYWDRETIRAFLEEVRSGSSRTKSRTGISSSVNVALAARRPAPSAIFSMCSTSWHRVQLELGGVCLSRCRMGRDELRARHGSSDNASRANERVIRRVEVAISNERTARRRGSEAVNTHSSGGVMLLRAVARWPARLRSGSSTRIFDKRC